MMHGVQMPMLDYLQAKRILDKYGIRSIASRYVKSGEDAIEFAGKKEIVLKVISNKAVHKSKAGLVKLRLSKPDEIREAFNELAKKGKKLAPYKILAQEMASGGVEAIIGGNTDAQFGKMILVGLGGVYVEIFKDVQLRLCPITRKDAESMLSELKSSSIITHDGKASAMLVSLLLKVSKMLTQEKRIKELDINPVIVREGAYEVVDIRIMT